MREDYEYEWNSYRLTTDECFYGVDSNANLSFEVNNFQWLGGECVLGSKNDEVDHFEDDQDLFEIM